MYSGEKHVLKRFFAGILSAALILGNCAQVVAEETTEGTNNEVELIARFTFDSEKTGFSGAGAVARAQNDGYALVTGKCGNALKLESGKQNYLNVTKEDGSSLLTDCKTLTISYFSKNSDRWSTFISDNADTQEWKYEHYLGVADGSTITIERYLQDNNENRPSTASTTYDTSDWRYVTIVVDEAETLLYVNGELKSSAASAVALKDITKNGGIFQIGKGNWGAGEYFNGYIDEYTVYRGAMDAEEVERLYAMVSASAVLTEGEIIEQAMNGVIFPYDEVYGNITLPEETEDGVTIAWTTNHPEIIDVEGHDIENYAYAPAGIITRPKEDTKVNLTATFKLGDVEKTADYTFTVKAAPKKLAKTTSYMFAHFTGVEKNITDEQIYFATSQDSDNWVDLTEDGNPILTSVVGEGGVRDPYILRSAEGDKFYILATDLSIVNRGGNWTGTITSASTNMVIWESTDLINWGEPRLIDVASCIPGAGCVWAPEAFYDEKTGEYVVFWATFSTESNKIGDGQNIYYAKTRDFYTFTDPVLWIDCNTAILDTTMLEVDGTYYRASAADAQIRIDKCDSIFGEWEIVGTLQSIFNNSMYSGSYLEGPELFAYCEDDWLTDEDGNPVETWGLMCDQFKQGLGYLPFKSTDLSDNTIANWSVANSVNFGNVKKRHGSIMTITTEEYDTLMDAYAEGYNATANPDNQKAARIVIDQIAEIGSVTADSKAAITAARAAYEDLTDTQKAMVTNYAVLTEAEKIIDALAGEETKPDEGTTPDAGTDTDNGNSQNNVLSTQDKSVEEAAKAQAQAGTVAFEDSHRAITSANTDKDDVAGSTFATFKLKGKEGNTSVKLSWSKVSNAEGYIIYGAVCGNKMERIAEVTSSKKSYTVQRLKKGGNYKYMVVAYKSIYGEKRTIATSVTVHVATKGGKYGNPTGIIYGKKKVTVKVGKSFTLKPKMKSREKVKIHISKFRFESSNQEIAAVNKKGKIVGMKKGNCYIYMYTQNGLYKRVKIFVK